MEVFRSEARVAGTMNALGTLACGAFLAPVLSDVAADLGTGVDSVKQATALSLGLSLVLALAELLTGRSLLWRPVLLGGLVAGGAAFAALAAVPSLPMLYAATLVAAVSACAAMPLRAVLAHRHPGLDGTFNARAQAIAYGVQTAFPFLTAATALASWRIAAALLAAWMLAQAWAVRRVALPPAAGRAGAGVPMLDVLRVSELWRALFGLATGQLALFYLGSSLEPTIRATLAPELGHLPAFALTVSVIVAAIGAARLGSLPFLAYYGRHANTREKTAGRVASRWTVAAAGVAALSAGATGMLPGVAVVVLIAVAAALAEIGNNSVATVSRTYVGRIAVRAVALSTVVTAGARYTGAQLAVVTPWAWFCALWVVLALATWMLVGRGARHPIARGPLRGDGTLGLELAAGATAADQQLAIVTRGGATTVTRCREHDRVTFRVPLVAEERTSPRVRRLVIHVRWGLRPRAPRRAAGTLRFGGRIPLAGPDGTTRATVVWLGGSGTWTLEGSRTTLRSASLAGPLSYATERHIA